MDVLAKKWMGSLRYREVDLSDRLLPSFPFCNEAFIARASGIQDDERCCATIEPLLHASIDFLSVDVGIESSRNKSLEEEVVEDNKEGVLPFVNKRKASWQSVSGQDVVGLALVRHLHPRKLARGSSHVVNVQNEVIDIPDDGNVEKVVYERTLLGLSR